MEFHPDICVVGGGPAGLVLAAELIGHGLEVLVLESGAERADPAVEALNEGSVSGDAYAGLSATRQRGIGGTARNWNTVVRGRVSAKCLPLDAVDFERRPGRDPSGWPFGADHLEPYYRRALAWCGLREPRFDGGAWTAPGARPFAGLSRPLVSRVYQIGTRDALLGAALTAIRGADGVTLRTHATVIRLQTGQGAGGVTAALVGAPGGDRWTVRARRFVLAAGAVENARLLLASAPERGGLGNESGWVGRCFMEHPRDRSLRLFPSSPGFYREAGFYDLHEGPDGTPVLGCLGLDGEALASGDLPNAAGTLLPRVRPGVLRARRAMGPLRTLPGLRRLLPAGGFGWSRHPVPRRVFEGMSLLLNVEQAPHPENRIRLGRGRDALGVPRPELHWRWRREDRERLARLRRLFAQGLEASGLGRVEVDEAAEVDPNAHHQAGTTRMHADPARGVADPDGRLHTVENVYAAGASVFPTAGFANPLLTILALSVRLADHLKATG